MGRTVMLLLASAAIACSATEKPGETSSGGSSPVGAGGMGGAGGGLGAQGGSSTVTTGGGGGAPAQCQAGSGGTLPVVDCAQNGIVIAPQYAADYTCLDLGENPGIPPKWGGLTTKLGDPDVLLIGGSANTDLGQLYELGIVRDSACHIVAFGAAPPVLFSEAAYNDGGVLYGPDDVLFLARWPVNEIGFLKPGSVVTDKIIDTDPLGVGYSLAALGFVPVGFGGAGQLKFVSWPNGEWYTVGYTPDGNGTFDIGRAAYDTFIVGGPEGFVYIEAGNPQFSQNGMLVSEWTANNIAAYDVDNAGNPLPATRRDFVTGLSGAEGAFLDPLSGDFLFSTFAEINRVIVIQGFAPPPPIPR
jgi:hypothetical protein